MKRKLVAVCLVLFVLGWMVLIFCFSSQNGITSGRLSAFIAKPVTELLMRLFPRMRQDESTIYVHVHYAIRKLAHFSEYAVLGGLLMLLFHCLKLRGIWRPWMMGTLYAASDEFHQLFTPDRSGNPVDVLIDSSGVICGVFIAYLLIKIWRKKKHVHDSGNV